MTNRPVAFRGPENYGFALKGWLFSGVMSKVHSLICTAASRQGPVCQDCTVFSPKCLCLTAENGGYGNYTPGSRHSQGLLTECPFYHCCPMGCYCESCFHIYYIKYTN